LGLEACSLMRFNDWDMMIDQRKCVKIENWKLGFRRRRKNGFWKGFTFTTRRYVTASIVFLKPLFFYYIIIIVYFYFIYQLFVLIFL
jgi:hypothetical protein